MCSAVRLGRSLPPGMTAFEYGKSGARYCAMSTRSARSLSASGTTVSALTDDALVRHTAWASTASSGELEDLSLFYLDREATRSWPKRSTWSRPPALRMVQRVMDDLSARPTHRDAHLRRGRGSTPNILPIYKKMHQHKLPLSRSTDLYGRAVDCLLTEGMLRRLGHGAPPCINLSPAGSRIISPCPGPSSTSRLHDGAGRAGHAI